MSLKDLNALTNFPQDKRGLSASKQSTFCRSFLLLLPWKLPPWYSSFFTLHTVSQSALWDHFASSALYILLPGPIRRCHSGGRRKNITGVSSTWMSHILRGCITFPNFFASFLHFKIQKSPRINLLSWQWLVGFLSYKEHLLYYHTMHKDKNSCGS